MANFRFFFVRQILVFIGRNAHRRVSAEKRFIDIERITVLFKFAHFAPPSCSAVNNSISLSLYGDASSPNFS